MKTFERLAEIWQQYADKLPEQIGQRKFAYSINHSQKDVLITGINPSCRKGDEIPERTDFCFEEILKKNSYDSYWSSLRNILYKNDGSLDYRANTAYLDIFYFRETNQNFLKKELIKSDLGVQFIAEQLNLTQQTIEQIIQPKVIIVKNKESAAYWGKLSHLGLIWMGYEFEHITTLDCGEVCRIKGLVNSAERISPEMKDSNLKGTIVLFSHHINQFTAKMKRPTADNIKMFFELYFAELN